MQTGHSPQLSSYDLLSLGTPSICAQAYSLHFSPYLRRWGSRMHLLAGCRSGWYSHVWTWHALPNAGPAFISFLLETSAELSFHWYHRNITLKSSDLYSHPAGRDTRTRGVEQQNRNKALIRKHHPSLFTLLSKIAFVSQHLTYCTLSHIDPLMGCDQLGQATGPLWDRSCPLMQQRSSPMTPVGTTEVERS